MHLLTLTPTETYDADRTLLFGQHTNINKVCMIDTYTRKYPEYPEYCIHSASASTDLVADPALSHRLPQTRTAPRATTVVAIASRRLEAEAAALLVVARHVESTLSLQSKAGRHGGGCQAL